ncbi:DUF3530 family protein [Methylophaga sp. OBS4]|uniref:DUF3530 family protein n=1 Tax=Methylophaga sp. OBS4 TaxID=2991935 RepID=UPI002252706F|nr:DUF3530 family protein [Methylophaga sp. OBS4]MCX4186255.1 alpha/beta hydrolase family protein [Methylophaga sp. OBS4]
MLNRFNGRSNWLSLIFLVSLSTSALAEEITETNEQAPAKGDVFLQRHEGSVAGYLSLPVGQTSVDATFMPEMLGRNHGKVLILHDVDGDIDGAGIVHNLRHALTKSGWSTMTVALTYPYQPNLFPSDDEQMQQKPDASQAAAIVTNEAMENSSEPAKEQTDTDDVDNAARVAAALTYLKAQAPGPQILLAVGKGAEVAAAAFSRDSQIAAGLIVIAADADIETFTELPSALMLLDIVATENVDSRKLAQFRRVEMIRVGQSGYAQRSVAASSNDFYGFTEPVFSLVRGWLHKYFVDKADS